MERRIEYEKRQARNNLHQKLKFYKDVKSRVVVDYFGSGDVYIPTFEDYKGGKILLGNIFDKNFCEKYRGLTMKILDNLKKCEKTGILYPARGSDGSHYFSNGFTVSRLMCMSLRAFEAREDAKQKYRTRRKLKNAHFKGSDYPYNQMTLQRLKLEAERIADATGCPLEF